MLMQGLRSHPPPRDTVYGLYSLSTSWGLLLPPAVVIAMMVKIYGFGFT